MPYQRFTDWEPRSETSRFILSNAIRLLDEYQAMGYSITVRQLSYAFVSKGLIANEQRMYKRLGDVITKAREGGYIDWTAIVDRGRQPVMPAHWASPAELLDAAREQFRVDRWRNQPNYVEVACEKEALAGVLIPVCRRYHVRFTANKGYSSASAMWEAAQRIQAAEERGQHPVLIYLGDHDPSGLDMSRDVEERLDLMSWGTPMETMRLALNYDQVEEYRPPPNPAKMTDSRAARTWRDTASSPGNWTRWTRRHWTACSRARSRP